MPLIILSILLSAIIIITPPFQMLLTYIHELGHDIHLKISSLQLKQKYSKSNIIITRKLYIFYSGYTHNPLYKYFEDNKMALEILNFFTSSDFKYFIKPEEYKYL